MATNTEYLKTLITTAGGDEWELINTASVTEDMGVNYIEITSDIDGNPFELRELSVIAKNVKHYNEYSYAQVNINGKIIGECRKRPNVFIHIRERAGIWVAEYSDWGYEISSPTTYGLGHTGFYHRTNEMPTINKIRIGFVSGEIEIWGLRK